MNEKINQNNNSEKYNQNDSGKNVSTESLIQKGINIGSLNKKSGNEINQGLKDKKKEINEKTLAKLKKLAEENTLEGTTPGEELSKTSLPKSGTTPGEEGYKTSLPETLITPGEEGDKTSLPELTSPGEDNSGTIPGRF